MNTPTPNDIAFLKISVELRRLENSVQALNDMRRVLVVEEYSRAQLQNIEDRDVFVPEVNALLPMIKIIKGGNKEYDALRIKLQNRLKKLREYCDIYLEGGDVVAAKLSDD